MFQIKYFSSSTLLVYCGTLLVSLGTIMVYSSSSVVAYEFQGDGFYFLKRQIFFVLCALVAFYMGTQIRTEWYKRYAYWIYLGALFLLVLVMIPGIGKSAGGAARWIRLGPFHLQAGELMKLALIFYMAASLDRKQGKMSILKVGIGSHILLPSLAMGLLLLEPDLGTTIVVGTLTFVMLFIGGARVIYLIAGFVFMLPVLWLAILQSPYRLNRLLAFLDPWSHRQDSGYQVVQSLLALGSGGIWGKGLGLGQSKLLYLPAARTDFILAVIGEELGFLGISLVILCFLGIAYAGFSIAKKLVSPFQAYLALGITTLMVFQAIFNAFVVLGLVPTKGITLPFVSYGGSSLILSSFMLGILIRLSQGKTQKGEAL